MIAARNIRNLVFTYFGIFFVFSLVIGRTLDPNVYLIIISVSSMFISSMMVVFMFKTTKVRGVDRTYELGPDLGIRKEILAEKVEIPEEGSCNQCERIVYKPFLCSDCKKLHCGQHSLPSDHDCPGRQ